MISKNHLHKHSVSDLLYDITTSGTEAQLSFQVQGVSEKPVTWYIKWNELKNKETKKQSYKNGSSLLLCVMRNVHSIIGKVPGVPIKRYTHAF